MQTILIDLKKSPDIADWAADKEPGDNVRLFGSIKSKDDQTMAVTVKEVGDGKEEEDEDEDELPEGGNEGSAGAPVTPGSLSALSGEDAMD